MHSNRTFSTISSNVQAADDMLKCIHSARPMLQRLDKHTTFTMKPVIPSADPTERIHSLHFCLQTSKRIYNKLIHSQSSRVNCINDVKSKIIN